MYLLFNSFPKNSMNRFGDDLTEEVLQYLTFEDKVRLECVSKQWRRLVFNKQFELFICASDSELTENSLKQLTRRKSVEIDRNALKSILKKCHYIRGIMCYLSLKYAEPPSVGQQTNRFNHFRGRGNGRGGNSNHFQNRDNRNSAEWEQCLSK